MYINIFCSTLNHEDFAILTDKIVDIFALECREIYFIPSVSGKDTIDRKPINARGKLIDKYRNLKRLYKNKKVFKSQNLTNEIFTGIYFLINLSKF